MIILRDGKVAGTFDGLYLTARTPELAELARLLEAHGVPYAEEDAEGPGLGLLRYLSPSDPRYSAAVRAWLRRLGYTI